MSTPKRPMTSHTIGSIVDQRKNSLTNSFLKPPESPRRIFSGSSKRASISNLKEKMTKLEFNSMTFNEPSTPSSITGTVKSRPFSRGLKNSSLNNFFTPRNLQSAKAGAGTFSRVTSAVKSFRAKTPMELLEMAVKEENGPTERTSMNHLKTPTESKMSLDSSPKMHSPISPNTMRGSSPAHRLSFLEIVSAKLKNQAKENEEHSHIEELKLKKKRAKQEQLAHTTVRHSDIPLELETQADVEVVLEYENEILGIYKNYKDMKEITNHRIQNKIQYLKQLRVKLLDPELRGVLLTMLKTKNTIARALTMKDIKKIIADLTLNLKYIVELDDVVLLMDALKIICETYLDFGQLDNAVFSYNQLRMGCELTDDVPRKIDAYLGLAEACKRLRYYEHAGTFLNRGLHFCWDIFDREKELKIYDQIGMISFTTRNIEKANYYHKKASSGKVEKETSTLFKLAKDSTDTYKRINHLGFKYITPAFFMRLAIPQPRHMKRTPGVSKTGRDKLRALIRKNDKSEEKSEDYFEESATVNQASVFIEKVMTKVYYKKGITREESPSPLFGNELNTEIEAIHQLEVILAEADFNHDVPSPRTFDIKEKVEVDKPLRMYEQTRHIKKGGDALGTLDKRMMVITAAEARELKKDRHKYSLQKIADENNLNVKYPNGYIPTAISKPDLFINFETFKRRAKKEYTSDIVDTKMFLGHLSPNRSTYGFPNVPDLKPQRYQRFFESALEHIVFDKNPKKQSQSYSHL